MIKCLYLLLFFFFFYNNQIINEKDIECITIENVHTAQSISIMSHEQVVRFAKLLNSSRQEFCIFRPDFIVTITYKNNDNMKVGLKGKMITIDGVPYRMNKKLLRIIESLVDKYELSSKKE